MQSDLGLSDCPLGGAAVATDQLNVMGCYPAYAFVEIAFDADELFMTLRVILPLDRSGLATMRTMNRICVF